MIHTIFVNRLKALYFLANYLFMVVLFISGGEIFVVMLVALLLFGSKSIPDVARTLGKGMREFRKATEDIKREIQNSETFSDIKNEVTSIKNDLTSDITSIKDNLTSEVDSIKSDLTSDVNEIKSNVSTDLNDISGNLNQTVDPKLQDDYGYNYYHYNGPQASNPAPVTPQPEPIIENQPSSADALPNDTASELATPSQPEGNVAGDDKKA